MSYEQCRGDAACKMTTYENRDSTEPKKGYDPSGESGSEEVDDEPEYNPFLNGDKLNPSKEMQRPAPDENTKQERQLSKQKRALAPLPSASDPPIRANVKETEKQKSDGSKEDARVHEETLASTKSTISEKEGERKHHSQESSANRSKKDKDSSSEDGELKDDDYDDSTATEIKQHQQRKEADQKREESKEKREQERGQQQKNQDTNNAREKRQKEYSGEMPSNRS